MRKRDQDSVTLPGSARAYHSVTLRPAELFARPDWAMRLAESRGPLWRAPALCAMEAETSNRLWLTLALDGDRLAGVLLVEQVTASGGTLGHVHHPHSGAEPAYWTAPGDERALGIMVGTLRRRLGPRTQSLLWRQVSPDDRLPGRRLVGRDTFSLGVVDLQDRDTEAWLRGLSKSRRGDLRRLRRRLSEDDRLSVETGPLVEITSGAEVSPLVRANFFKHNPRRHPLMSRPAPAAWLDTAGQDGGLWAIGYRIDRRLVAVGVLCLHRDEARWMYWGVDYEREADKRGLYYDCIHRIVELCEAQSVARLTLGKGAIELKSSFGAAEHPQQAQVRTLR